MVIIDLTEAGIAPLIVGAGGALLKIANWATVLWLGYDVYGALTETDLDAVAAGMPGGTAGECMERWGGGEIDPLSDSSRAYHATQLENWRPYAAAELVEDPVALAAANATIGKAVELIASGESPDGAPVTICDVQAAALIIARQVDNAAGSSSPTPTVDEPEGLTEPRVSRSSRSPWLWGALALAAASSSWWLWQRSR